MVVVSGVFLLKERFGVNHKECMKWQQMVSASSATGTRFSWCQPAQHGWIGRGPSPDAKTAASNRSQVMRIKCLHDQVQRTHCHGASAQGPYQLAKHRARHGCVRRKMRPKTLNFIGSRSGKDCLCCAPSSVGVRRVRPLSLVEQASSPGVRATNRAARTPPEPAGEDACATLLWRYQNAPVCLFVWRGGYLAERRPGAPGFRSDRSKLARSGD